jgi:hypothetical protein
MEEQEPKVRLTARHEIPDIDALVRPSQDLCVDVHAPSEGEFRSCQGGEVVVLRLSSQSIITRATVTAKAREDSVKGQIGHQSQAGMDKERKRPHLGDQVLLHHSSKGEGDPVDVTLEGHLHLSLSGLPLLMTSDSDG